MARRPRLDFAGFHHIVNRGIYFNKKYKRTGHLWQRRYKSWYIIQQEYLYTLFRYIEHNPIEAKMSRSVGEYPFTLAATLLNADQEIIPCAQHSKLKKEIQNEGVTLITLIVILSAASCASTAVKPTSEVKLKGTIEVFSEDVSDYNSQTGVGCLVTKDPKNKLQAHVVCRSKHSGEHAWNAVTAGSKQLCTSQKWTMLFKRPPSLPKKNGIFGAQMDIVCIQ